MVKPDQSYNPNESFFNNLCFLPSLCKRGNPKLISECNGFMSCENSHKSILLYNHSKRVWKTCHKGCPQGCQTIDILKECNRNYRIYNTCLLCVDIASVYCLDYLQYSTVLGRVARLHFLERECKQHTNFLYDWVFHGSNFFVAFKRWIFLKRIGRKYQDRWTNFWNADDLHHIMVFQFCRGYHKKT